MGEVKKEMSFEDMAEKMTDEVEPQGKVVDDMQAEDVVEEGSETKTIEVEEDSTEEASQ